MADFSSVVKRKRKTLAERFWSKVKKAGLDECWEWQGCRNKKRGGYGMLMNSDTRAPMWAHRVSYKLHHPDEDISALVIMHSCDNPCCVNPNHLSPGTTLDNVLDACGKGRLPLPTNSPKGETHHSAVLTDITALEVLLKVKLGCSLTAVAKEYGVTKSAVWRLKEGKSWKHLQTC